jgi:hypothetical protein
MQIRRTRPDPDYHPPSRSAPTYVTDDSRWWDGSQIYGSDRQSIEARRGPDGTLRVEEHHLIPDELEKQLDLTGVAGRGWAWRPYTSSSRANTTPSSRCCTSGSPN